MWLFVIILFPPTPSHWHIDTKLLSFVRKSTESVEKMILHWKWRMTASFTRLVSKLLLLTFNSSVHITNSGWPILIYCKCLQVSSLLHGNRPQDFILKWTGKTKYHEPQVAIHTRSILVPFSFELRASFRVPLHFECQGFKGSELSIKCLLSTIKGQLLIRNDLLFYVCM